jgi:predicted nucleotidyltransferase
VAAGFIDSIGSVRSKGYGGLVVDDAVIGEIGRRLAQGAPDRSRIVLFGSRARLEERPGSDADVLVIEPTVADPIRESVRLRGLLRGLGVPVDVLVVSRAEATRRSAVRGTVVERALREGLVLVDA